MPSRAMSARRPWMAPGLALCAVAASSSLLAGCSMTVGDTARQTGGNAASKASPSPKVSQVDLTSNVANGSKDIPVGRHVRIKAAKGTLTSVVVSQADGHRVAGAISSDKKIWRATARLTPDTSYVMRTTAIDNQGISKRMTTRFRTAKLTLDEQTYPSVYPTAGADVGIGMPIMVSFDIPVKNRKLFEQHMHVTTSSGQQGSWYWIDSQHVHFRPKHFWKGNQTIKVNLDLGGLYAGKGIYGQLSRHYSFHIGRPQYDTVNMDTHQMHVYRDGKLINTIPITTGEQPQYTTRSGIKVIVEKYLSIDMNSGSVGIDPNSPEGYNLKGVEYAMRLTYSGEFIHAAPWSVSSQGYANVSHGCTGMSTSNAAWLFDHSMIGDPVIYTGSNRPMTLTNGYGDWNLSWRTWKDGSAAHG